VISGTVFTQSLNAVTICCCCCLVNAVCCNVWCCCAAHISSFIHGDVTCTRSFSFCWPSNNPDTVFIYQVSKWIELSDTALLILHLKTGLNDFPLFTTKRIKGFLCLGDWEKCKDKYLCSFKWWFWCRKILRSKLPRTSLAVPEVSVDVTSTKNN